MTIGLLSLDQHWENKEANKVLCKDAAVSAAKLGVNLLIFPEMTLTGFSMRPDKIAEDINHSGTIDFFIALATECNLGIVFGVCLKEPAGVTNCAIYISHTGNVEALYRKTHPFTFAGEDKHFSPGSDIATFSVEGITAGLTICYDLRFPEFYRLYADCCTMVINIANWPENRIDHWLTLLKARAIENQYIVIGVNRTGTDGNQLTYIESSEIFLPDGSIPNVLYQNNGLKIVEITPDSVIDYRLSFPVLKDRRLDLYTKLEVNVKK